MFQIHGLFMCMSYRQRKGLKGKLTIILNQRIENYCLCVISIKKEGF